MRVSIVHETLYRYRSPAAYSIQYLRLWPQASRRQKVLSWKLDAPAPLRRWVDGFGNDAHVLVVDRPHEEIRVRARGEVVVDESSDVVEDPGPHPPALYLRPTRLTEATGVLAEFAEQFRADVRQDPRNVLETLMMAVREQVDYQPGITHTASTAQEAFAAGAGVCQDHAHIFLACCRHLGVAARYVSGYLGVGTERNGAARADGRAGDARLASHAWAEAWLEGEGWHSYDIASRLRPAARHVRVAVGLDYLDACPVRGYRRGALGESMEVEVRVNDAQQSPPPPVPRPEPRESNGHALQQQPGRQQQQQ
jgi:transglutaminase-like putative cysteine protease